MIVLQVRGVHDSVRVRLGEWVSAGVACLWGFIVLKGDAAFTTPAWATLAKWGGYQFWGTSLLIIGAIRIAILSWNGRWDRCHQARYIMAWISGFFWACITASLILFGANTGVAAYIGWFILDLGTIYIANFDAARLEEARRNGTA